MKWLGLLLLLFLACVQGCSLPVNAFSVTSPGSLVLEGSRNSDGIVDYRILHFFQIPPAVRVAGVVVQDTVPVPVLLVGQAAIDSVLAGAWKWTEISFRKHENESDASAAIRVKDDYDNRKSEELKQYIERYRLYGTFLAD